MSTGTYAKETRVTVERTRNEIERTLERYGASGFGYMRHEDRHMLIFEANRRRIRFAVTMPDLAEFALTPSGKQKRTATQQQNAYDQAARQRWRALLLVIKAKLEAVDAGIVTFEDEFLANTVLANGQTVGEWAGPQINQLYDSGRMPPLLPGA